MKESFGIIETYGLIAAVKACDTALKSANVVLESVNYIRGGIVSITFRGDVGAVKACIDSGVSEASRGGIVLGSSVIPRLDSQVDKIISSIQAPARAVQSATDVNKEAVKQVENKKLEEEKRQVDVRKQRENDEKLKFEEEKKLEELKRKTEELKKSEDVRKAEMSKKVEPPKHNNNNGHGGNNNKKAKR